MNKFIICIIILSFISIPYFSDASENKVETIKVLNPYKNKKLKSFRNDVRKSIYTIKSKRPEDELPGLKFLLYTIKKDDTFWDNTFKIIPGHGHASFSEQPGFA